MSPKINPKDILYQERWQSLRRGSELTGVLRLGPLYFTAPSVTGLLHIMVLKDRLLLEPMFLKGLFRQYSYEIPFEKIERFEVIRRRWWKILYDEYMELVFLNSDGTRETIEFSARNPDKIRSLCKLHK